MIPGDTLGITVATSLSNVQLRPAGPNNVSPSDGDDLHLFTSLNAPEKASVILVIKSNDPEVKHLTLDRVYMVFGRESVEAPGVHSWSKHRGGRTDSFELEEDVIGLGDGLQINQCIKRLILSGINLQNTEKFSSFWHHF